jgi:hypothetical protein
MKIEMGIIPYPNKKFKSGGRCKLKEKGYAFHNIPRVRILTKQHIVGQIQCRCMNKSNHYSVKHSLL